MSTVQILLDDLNCYELKTLPLITEKSETVCEHLGFHENTERILNSTAFQHSCVLFIAVSPGIDCHVHYYGLRKFKLEGF